MFKISKRHKIPLEVFLRNYVMRDNALTANVVISGEGPRKVVLIDKDTERVSSGGIHIAGKEALEQLGMGVTVDYATSLRKLLKQIVQFLKG